MKVEDTGAPGPQASFPKIPVTLVLLLGKENIAVLLVRIIYLLETTKSYIGKRKEDWRNGGDG